MNALAKLKSPSVNTTRGMSKTLYSDPIRTRLLSIDTDEPQRKRSLEARKHNARRIAERIDRFLASEDIRMEFYIDKDTATLRIKIIQNPSGRVIREIPAGKIPGVPRIIDLNV